MEILLFVKAETASLFLVSWLCELVATKELRIMSVNGRDTMLRSLRPSGHLFLLLLNVALFRERARQTWSADMLGLGGRRKQ